MNKYFKKIKGVQNRMEPNSLTLFNYLSNNKYLNVSFSFFNNHAGMAEWLMQFINTGCPLGLGGSIPSASVIYNQEVQI